MSLNGQVISTPVCFSRSNSSHQTTKFVPLYYVMKLLQRAGWTSSWNGRVWGLNGTTAKAIQPQRRQGTTSSLQISLNGKTVQSLPKLVRVDPASGKNTTYVPISALSDFLKQLSFQISTDKTSLSILQPNHPIYGGTLQLDTSDPLTVDPATATDSASTDFISQVYNTLVTLNNQNQKIEPSLAKSFEVSSDGLTYTFHLRKDVKFSNGDGLTAKAFVDEFDRVLGKDHVSSSGEPYLNPLVVGAADYAAGKSHQISGITTPTPYTLVIKLNHVEPYFLDVLSLPYFSAVDSSYIAKVGEKAFSTTAMMGTGPFELKKADSSAYVLTRNPHYWKKNKYGGTLPYLNRVTLNVHFNSVIQASHFLHGSTGLLSTFTNGVPLGFQPAFTQSDRAKKTLQTFTQNAVYYAGMNANIAPFNDPKFRLAMEYAINKKNIVAHAEDGNAQVANQPLPPGMPGYDKNLPADVQYTYNPPKARKLLAQAGYQPGQTTVTLYASNDTLMQGMASSIQTDLEAVGVHCNLKTLSFRNYLVQIMTGKTAFYVAGWEQDYLDPADFLNTLFNSSESPQNNMNEYSNPQVDAWLNQANQTMDKTQRFSLYQKVTAQVLRDATWVPLFYPENVDAVQPWLRGYYNTQQGYTPLSTMWIDASKQ